MNKLRAMRKRQNELSFLNCLNSDPSSLARNKLEFAKLLLPDQELCATLPDDWLNTMHQIGYDAEPHFVLVIPNDDHPYCTPITATGIRIISIVASRLLKECDGTLWST